MKYYDGMGRDVTDYVVSLEKTIALLKLPIACPKGTHWDAAKRACICDEKEPVEAKEAPKEAITEEAPTEKVVITTGPQNQLAPKVKKMKKVTP